MKRKHLINSILISCISVKLLLPALASTGNVDPFFNTAPGVDVPVTVVGLQPDGKIVIQGRFTHLRGFPHPGIARLQPNGQLDEEFHLNLGTNGSVSSMAVQNDGKLLIAGAFTEVNGIPRHGLARLHANGTLDASWLAVTGAVTRILLHADGRILAGVNGDSGIVRLHPDGSLDPSFQAEVTGSQVDLLAVQADDKVIIRQSSLLTPGRWRSELRRLTGDGRLDSTFNIASGRPIDGPVWIQPDGRILVGLARYFPDGSPDPSFDPGNAPNRDCIDDCRLRAIAKHQRNSLHWGNQRSQRRR